MARAAADQAEEDERFTEPIMVRFTPAQAAEIKQQAKETGIKPSQIVRVFFLREWNRGKATDSK